MSSIRDALYGPAKVGIVAAALGLAAIAGAGSASATAAYGPSYIGSNSGGANVRTCASTGCGAIAYLGNGTAVTMLCWIDGQYVAPPQSDYASARWFRIASPGGTGYTHSSLVENQTGVGAC